MNLQIGSPAPDFSANNQKGETLSIGHFTGKNWYCIFIQRTTPLDVLLKLAVFATITKI